MSSILMFWRYKLQEVQGKYMTPHLGESDMLTVVLLLEHNGAPLGAEAFRQIASKIPQTTCPRTKCHSPGRPYLTVQFLPQLHIHCLPR